MDVDRTLQVSKQKFFDDLKILYKYLDKNRQDINSVYSKIENKEYTDIKLIYDFAKELKISKIDDALAMALASRVVDLKENLLITYFKNKKHSKDEITNIMQQAYLFVKNYWHNIHKQTVSYIEQNNLFNSFYIEIFRHTYEIGIEFSKLYISWNKHIINNVNVDLKNRFNGNTKQIIDFLQKNSLLDLDEDGSIADRCYSVIVMDNKTKEYKRISYFEAFKKDINKILDKLENFMNTLIELEDNIFNAKWDYVLYIQTLIKALGEKNIDKLIKFYREVDIAWMKIKTPIQIAHPFEYYEDHYRKSVTIEWDIRISNPNITKNIRAEKIKSMYNRVFNKIQTKKEHTKIYQKSLKSLNSAQLYISRPAIFFASYFNGLFSAQVIPNDEIVSLKFGKKIFAFSDEVLQISRAKPLLELEREIFGEKFIKEYRNYLFKEKDKWHTLYDISTIGHEYGHILWCDDNSEQQINSSGNFKNIEEFKATCGGLVSYFMDRDNENIDKEILIDTVKRAVGLISWMKILEAEPYYCEGLIHLKILFSSKILSWSNSQLAININDNNYKKLQNLYIQTYEVLATIYLEKKDASIFLNQFAKKENDVFLPIDENIKSFVKYYYKRYEEIGTKLDTNDNKSNYK